MYCTRFSVIPPPPSPPNQPTNLNFTHQQSNWPSGWAGAMHYSVLPTEPLHAPLPPALKIRTRMGLRAGGEPNSPGFYYFCVQQFIKAVKRGLHELPYSEMLKNLGLLDSSEVCLNTLSFHLHFLSRFIYLNFFHMFFIMWVLGAPFYRPNNTLGWNHPPSNEKQRRWTIIALRNLIF